MKPHLNTSVTVAVLVVLSGNAGPLGQSWVAGLNIVRQVSQQRTLVEVAGRGVVLLHADGLDVGIAEQTTLVGIKVEF